MVAGIPFKSLYDAEEYCARLELPPTKDFLAYNPAEAKRLSLSYERELKFVVDLLEDAQKYLKIAGAKEIFVTSSYEGTGFEPFLKYFEDK